MLAGSGIGITSATSTVVRENLCKAEIRNWIDLPKK